MNFEELLSFLKQNDAFIANPSNERDIQITNSVLQNISAAIFPLFIMDFYKDFGGIVFGGSYIFGPAEINDPKLKYPIPSISEINNNLSGLKQLRGKTIFGRNDLFLFAFDAFGKCFMLNNLNLSVLREYEDPLRAIQDCLIIGKL